MALLRDMVLKRRPNVRELIAEEIKLLNLKILQKLTIRFDPFRNDVKEIRDFSYFIHSRTSRASNLKLLIKTEVLTDRSEQTLTFDLSNGQTILFKCANLKALEIFRLINKHITPLSPVEDLMQPKETKLSKKQKKR